MLPITGIEIWPDELTRTVRVRSGSLNTTISRTSSGAIRMSSIFPSGAAAGDCPNAQHAKTRINVRTRTKGPPTVKMDYSIAAMASEEKSLEIVRKSYPAEITPMGPVSVPYGDYEGRTAHLREYLNVILARRASFAAVLLTVLGIGIISIYKQTPVYRANVTIEIDREDTRVLSFEGVAPTLSAADDVLQTQFKILASQALAKDVVQDLHLDKEKLHKDQPKSVVDNYYANLTGYLANLFSAVLPPGSTA